MSKQMLFSVAVAAALAGCSSSGNPIPVTPVAGTTPAPTTAPTAVATSTAAATASPSASPSSIASTTPSATPTPTATANATASAITSSVDPIILTSNVHSGGCATPNIGFTISESGYSGSFTAVSGNTTLVTVTQQNGQNFTAVEESSMDVAQGTTTNITVADSNNNKLVIPVNFNGICLP